MLTIDLKKTNPWGRDEKSYPRDPYFVKKYPRHNFYLRCVHFGTSLLDNQKESEQKNSLVDLKGGVLLLFVQQGKP